MAYSPLTQAQMQQLTIQGCTSGDWTGVLAGGNTDLSCICDIQFFGAVLIGSTRVRKKGRDIEAVSSSVETSTIVRKPMKEAQEFTELKSKYRKILDAAAG